MAIPAFARRLDWNLLWVFRTIVDEGGIGAAARALHRQQPSVSLSLRRLEEQLGTTLCLRTPQGVELTEAGRALDEACRAMVGLVADLPMTLGRANAALTGAITVQIVSDLVLPPLDRAFAAFHRAHPGLEIRIAVAGWRDVLRAVERREATVGIACMGAEDRGFRRHRIGSERQQLYCGRHHPLFGTTQVSPEALAGESFVLREGGEAENVEIFRRVHGLGRRIRAAAETLTEAKRLIGLGLGIGFLPEGMVDPRIDALWGLLPEEALPAYDLFAVTRADLPPGHAGTRFLETLLEQLDS